MLAILTPELLPPHCLSFAAMRPASRGWYCFSQTANYLPDVDLADAIARTIQQPDVVLAQRQDVELAVASEERQ